MTQKLETRTASGETISAALATPPTQPAAGLILIHEWWGLNDEMRELADDFAKKGFLTVAVDLFRGQATDQRERAQSLMAAMDKIHAAEVLAAWITWLRKRDTTNGKVGTLGFCLGGSWALNAAIVNPVDATVVYYGAIDKKASELRSLRGPVLGHFGSKDGWATVASAKAFESQARSAGKSVEIYVYEADHAFARINGANYHRPSAELAAARSLEFLKKHLAVKD